MRTMVFAISFSLAGASVAQSQQAQSLQPAQSPASTGNFVPQQSVAGSANAADLRPVYAPIGITRSQSGVNTVKSNHVAEPGAAVAVDPDTRNMLAIIGAIVVVVALVAFIL